MRSDKIVLLKIRQENAHIGTGYGIHFPTLVKTFAFLVFYASGVKLMVSCAYIFVVEKNYI